MCRFPRLACLFRAGALLVLLVAVILGALEASLRYKVHALRSRAPPLGELDRLNETDLRREDFYKNYVLRRRPVIIRLSDPDHWNATAFVEQCGDTKVNLLSPTSFYALREANMIWWLRLAFELMSPILLGRRTTLLDEILSRHDIALSDYLASSEKASGGDERDFSMGLPLLLLYLLPTKVSYMVQFFRRPPYLHDASLDGTCPEGMDWFHVPKYIRPNWAFPAKPDDFFDEEFRREPVFFHGRALTTSYPMHKNVYDLDFFMVALQGRKRYAVFPEDQHDLLNPIMLSEDFSSYDLDPFSPDLIAAPGFSDAKGWKGMLEAGELLYVPGESIHYFENYDFKQPTAVLKFWYDRHTFACRRGIDAATCSRRHGLKLPREGEADPTVSSYMAEHLSARERVKL